MIKPFVSITLWLLVGVSTFAGDKPNILFITVDDLNDFPAFTGRYPDAKTPNMDRLAERGVVFTNAHCQYLLCGPSAINGLKHQSD